MFLALRLQEPKAKPFNPAIITIKPPKLAHLSPGVHRPIIYAFLSWYVEASDGQFNFFVDKDTITGLLHCLTVRRPILLAAWRIWTMTGSAPTDQLPMDARTIPGA